MLRHYRFRDDVQESPLEMYWTNTGSHRRTGKQIGVLLLDYFSITQYAVTMLFITPIKKTRQSILILSTHCGLDPNMGFISSPNARPTYPKMLWISILA